MKLTFWNDKAAKHRWRLRAANGEVVAASTEGFSSEAAMLRNVRLTFYGLLEFEDQWKRKLQEAEEADAD